MIPKIIWQTHEFEYDGLPDTWLRNSNSWKDMNPDYEYKYVSARERKKMMKEMGFLSEYEKIRHPRQKSELWRYLTLLKYGGFYVDMDSICLSPLNFDHSKSLIVQARNNGNEFYFNGYFACEKGNQVISSFCDALLTFVREKQDQITPNEMTMGEWTEFLNSHVGEFDENDFDLYSSPILQNENLKNIEFIRSGKYPVLKLMDGVYYIEDILMDGTIQKENIPLRKNKEYLGSDIFSASLGSVLSLIKINLKSDAVFFTNPSRSDFNLEEYTIFLVMNNDFYGGLLSIGDCLLRPVARSIYVLDNDLNWDITPVTGELQLAGWAGE